MNWGRGLFRLWVVLAGGWLMICGAIAVADGRWLEADKTYEVEGRFKERYEITAPARATESEVVAFAQKNQRSECTEIKTGPWCSHPVKLQMPRGPFDWFLVYTAVGAPVVVLLLGAALYWAVSGFRRSA